METDDGVPVVRATSSRSVRTRILSALRRRLPIVATVAEYDRGAALGDLVAGVTLGLTLVPQSIAYAALAGIPVSLGLYSALAGGLVYATSGTVRQVSIGPTSLMALITLQTCHNLPLAYVPLLAFCSGLVVLLMGLLRLGFLVELISPAATGGFTSGTALIVAIAQVKGLLGLSFLAESVPDNVLMVIQHWREIRLGDCLLSATCCVVLLLLRKLKDVKVSPKRRMLQKTLWLISIGRNALVVTLAATLAFLTSDPHQLHHPWFKLSGRVQAGLPSLQWPVPWSMAAPQGNGTVTLPEAVRALGPALMVTPVVMVLANIAIAKAFARGRVDATQEMVALGLCNVLGACLHAMPTCGAFTRSAVSDASGVRSPIAGLYSGLITILALVFLTEYFYFIPKASLSSVLVCAVVFMVDVSFPRSLWSRGERLETLVWAVTLAASLTLGVEAALVLGAALSLAKLLRRLSRVDGPPTLHKSSLGALVVMRTPPALVYLNAGRWTAEAAAAADATQANVLLLDCAALAIVDDTAIQELQQLSNRLCTGGTRLAAFAAGVGPAGHLLRLPVLSAECLRARDLPAALHALAKPTAPAKLDKDSPLEGCPRLEPDSPLMAVGEAPRWDVPMVTIKTHPVTIATNT